MHLYWCVPQQLVRLRNYGPPSVQRVAGKNTLEKFGDLGWLAVPFLTHEPGTRSLQMKRVVRTAIASEACPYGGLCARACVLLHAELREGADVPHVIEGMLFFVA